MDGHRLRELRRERGLTQVELARQAQVSAAAVARLERQPWNDRRIGVGVVLDVPPRPLGQLPLDLSVVGPVAATVPQSVPKSSIRSISAEPALNTCRLMSVAVGRVRHGQHDVDDGLGGQARH